MPTQLHRSRPRIIRIWGTLLVPLLLGTVAPQAQADVLVREKTSSSGIMGMGATDGQSTTIISGPKQQRESEVAVQGMPAGMGGDGPMVSVDIVRLDKEVIWKLDNNKKEYTEMTFAEMKEMMSGGGMMGSGNDSKPDDFEFTVKVETPGSKKEINGFATEQKILRITGKSTGEDQTAEIQITADMWIAAEVPGLEELQSFHRGFADKLGIDPSMFQSAGGMAQMMGGSVGRLAEEMKKLDGYPILMVMTISTPQMGAMAGMPEGMEQMDMEAMMKAVEAAKGGDPEAAQRMMADMEKNMGSAKKPAPSSGETMAATITVRHEVMEIRTTEVPEVSFTVPTDFTKVKMTMPY
jgi:hypothetical protein